MTIEKELADNTAAVKALTEVMRELIAAVGCSSLSALPSADVRATQASCQPSVYGPASPAEEAAAVAHADGLTASAAIIDEPPAPAPAPAPSPLTSPLTSPAPAPAPVSGAVVPDTLEGMRSMCIRAGEAGLTSDIVNFLHAHGVNTLRDLPQAEYGALVALLNSKGVK